MHVLEEEKEKFKKTRNLQLVTSLIMIKEEEEEKKIQSIS